MEDPGDMHHLDSSALKCNEEDDDINVVSPGQVTVEPGINQPFPVFLLQVKQDTAIGEEIQMKRGIDSVEEVRVKQEIDSVEEVRVKQDIDRVEEVCVKQEIDSVEDVQVVKQEIDSVDEVCVKQEIDSVDEVCVKQEIDSVEDVQVNQQFDGVEDVKVEQDTDSIREEDTVSKDSAVTSCAHRIFEHKLCMTSATETVSSTNPNSAEIVQKGISIHGNKKPSTSVSITSSLFRETPPHQRKAY